MFKLKAFHVKWFAVFILIAFLAVCFYYSWKTTEGYSIKDPDDLMSTLLKSDKTVAYFFSPSCGWCTKMTPIYDSVSSKYNGAKFVKIDSSKNRDLVNQYKVDGYPTILFFNGSKVVGTSSGYVEEKTLLSKMNESLGAKSSGLPISQNPPHNA
jgi:thiol-disulfide isomerase/thioredoxin